MLLPLLAAAQLPKLDATAPPISSKAVTLNATQRLTRARIALKGQGEVNSVGTTRVRTWLEKGDDKLSLTAYNPVSYTNGLMRLKFESHLSVWFATKPKKMYVVTIYGKFDCTEIGTAWGDSKGDMKGNAAVTIGSGETTLMIGVKATDVRMAALVFRAKGGQGTCNIERAEVSEIN